MSLPPHIPDEREEISRLQQLLLSKKTSLFQTLHVSQMMRLNANPDIELVQAINSINTKPTRTYWEINY